MACIAVGAFTGTIIEIEVGGLLNLPKIGSKPVRVKKGYLNLIPLMAFQRV